MVQAAVDATEAGDIGQLSAGACFENVVIDEVHGAANDSIVIRAAPGEEVIINEAAPRLLEPNDLWNLLKSDHPDTIVKAVEDVIAGDAVLSPRSTRQLLDRFRDEPGGDARAQARELVATLSEHEIEVARGVGRGLSNANVAGELYVSEATVKTHLSSVQAKLGARNRVDVAVLAERAGLLTE
ncbi:response regulator transcription factor [Ruania alkalisoli]|uniref:Response regulator transcription factor n=1 Tax=Ruania alkalisoli TaxID=2779775 RepID=A0A7M1SVZ8_9MICO|nr:response regulator transcription factor [Ruania alkalisoli]QOR71641.1 response regulator transcription factor [Ruania alkalisoli]